ncbi:MAG: FAD-binding protein [Chloroflexi bacterium]|nr:FAD-binding protein [Chloroflexota bacterium]MXY13282.1 FAD-binding protein [Chloroflexota bacterium]
MQAFESPRGYQVVRQASGSDLQARFAEIVGPRRVRSDPSSLAAYGIDATVGYRGYPALAVFPTTAAAAASALALAGSLGLAVTARGGGTSLAAGATPLDGSIVICTELIDQPLVVDPDALSVRCGAGVKTAQIDAAAAEFDLFLAPDPGARAISVIGGNVATNAGGALGLAYGVIRHHVLGLEYATVNGHIHHVRRGGADEGMVDLLIGSEGTLGLITAVDLALLPAPPRRHSLVARCVDAAAAARATIALLERGFLPARIEFMDDVAVRAVQAARDRGLDLSVGAYLLIEFVGRGSRPQRQVEAALQALQGTGGIDAEKVAGQRERSYWEARHAITSSLARVRPGKIGEDICLPRTRLPDAVDRIKQIAAELDLPIALFGHIGDGTLHPNVLYDPLDEDQRARAAAALGRIAETSIELGGVLSGEHGLGRVKRDHLEAAFDADTLAVFQRLRDAADPGAVLNRPLQWVGR